MEVCSHHINLFHGFIAIVLLSGSFWFKPKTNSWLLYFVVIVGFTVGGVIIHSYLLTGSAVLSGLINIWRLRRQITNNKPIEVILISDHDDQYLQYFLNYYRADITKYFPRFDFKIEEEFLVALIMSKMETVGLIVAEIKNAETLRICLDYIVPKHRRSQLAKTFYHCELRCVDFLGYRYLYIEPQSKEHNRYLENIGFRLIDGKYFVISCQPNHQSQKV